MANRQSTTFTPVELEFMQIIWDHEDISTEELQEALSLQDRALADGSIRKILSILMKKGHVNRTRCGKGYRYKATTVKDQANKSIIHDLLNRAFSGSAPGMVAALLDSREIDETDLGKIKKMIADYEKGEGQ